MQWAVAVVLGVLGVLAATVLAPRVRVPAPLILVVVGIAVSFLPGVGPLALPPEVVLAGVLPPLLYSAAVSLPTMDFRRDSGPIGGLSVTLVIVTAVVLGYVLHWLLPGVGLATAIALAAVISPTDAVATRIVGGLGVPPRVVTILEGESLLNDPSALVILRSAVAATAVSVSLWQVAGDFVYAVVVAVAIGYLVGLISLFVRSRLRDAVVTTSISFVVPFVAYLPAEHLGASGLVAVVVAGLLAGSRGPRYLSAADRRTEEANWRTIELLLEGGVFLVMGLEVHGLINEVYTEHGGRWGALRIGVLAWLGVLIVRALFLTPLLLGQRRDRTRMPAQIDRLDQAQHYLDEGRLPSPVEDDGPRRGLLGSLLVWRERRFEGETPERKVAVRGRVQQFVNRRRADIDYLLAEPLGYREGVVLVWAGMRGAVTVAAAQSLPEDTPQRPVLVLVAFIVAAGGLVVQGSTLPVLIRRLGLSGTEGGGSQAQILQLAAELAQVAAGVCDRGDLLQSDGTAYHARVVELVRAESMRIVDEDVTAEVPGSDTTWREQYWDLRLVVIRAKREALLQARSVGAHSSDALSQMLAILDADEIGVRLRGVS